MIDTPWECDDKVSNLQENWMWKALRSLGVFLRRSFWRRHVLSENFRSLIDVMWRVKNSRDWIAAEILRYGINGARKIRLVIAGFVSTSAWPVTLSRKSMFNPSSGVWFWDGTIALTGKLSHLRILNPSLVILFFICIFVLSSDEPALKWFKTKCDFVDLRFWKVFLTKFR